MPWPRTKWLRLLQPLPMPREFSDPYTYPSTSVLRNIPGLRAESALRCLEHDHAALRIEELCENPISGWIDLVHLKAIHAHVFQDVCEWAGEVRRTNMVRVNYPGRPATTILAGGGGGCLGSQCGFSVLS